MDPVSKGRNLVLKFCSIQRRNSLRRQKTNILKTCPPSHLYSENNIGSNNTEMQLITIESNPFLCLGSQSGLRSMGLPSITFVLFLTIVSL